MPQAQKQIGGRSQKYWEMNGFVTKQEHIIRAAECTLIRSWPCIDIDAWTVLWFQRTRVSLCGWSGLLIFCYYHFTTAFEVCFMFLHFNFSLNKRKVIVILRYF